MIKFENVTKYYDRSSQRISVLKNINFQISAGELVAIMGPSGSGKSTTMNIIGLLDRPSAGHYYLHQKNVTSLPSDELAQLRNREIGFVFQSFFLLPRLTALENICLPLLYQQIDTQIMREKAVAQLRKVDMETYANHKPTELSGGQQQRVAIARALVSEPHIILADEPTGALDSKTGQMIMDLLLHLNETTKTTVIIITHDQHIAEQCKRIIHIADGCIV